MTPPSGRIRQVFQVFKCFMFYLVENCCWRRRPDGSSPQRCGLPSSLSPLPGRRLGASCCPHTWGDCGHTGESLRRTHLCPEVWSFSDLQTNLKKGERERETECVSPRIGRTKYYHHRLRKASHSCSFGHVCFRNSLCSTGASSDH